MTREVNGRAQRNIENRSHGSAAVALCRLLTQGEMAAV
jgi:hypothetical protein